MFVFSYTQTLRRIIGVFLIFGIFFHFASADVFAPSSCEDLYSDDLVAELSNQIDYRINGLTGDDTTKKLFSTRGTDSNPWTRNTNVWTATGTPLDMTGVSPWNSESGYTKGGTLISPRHIVFAHHYPIATSSTIVFVADDNTIVTRTLVAQTEITIEPLLDDIQLGVLDSDVPSSIAFYPVLSKNQAETLLSDPIAPLVLFDQEEKMLVTEMDYSNASYFDHILLAHFAPPATSTRYAFYEGLVDGDSGKPAFFVLNNQPILALTTTTAGSGPFYGAYVQEINDAILSLGNDGGYQVSSYDTSCFINNVSPVVTSDTFTLPENSSAGTVVGTVVASDANASTTITYAIESGNTDSAFAIDAATGELTVMTEEAIDFETNPTFNLVISATDDWWIPATATGTIQVDLEDVAEVASPTVVTDAASSINKTTAVVNGTLSATGGENASSQGFIYGLTTAYGATTTESGDFSTGSFSSTLSSLACATGYHFKAWALNTAGIAYGGDATFTTSSCSGGGGGGGSSGGSRSTTTTTEPEDEIQPEAVSEPSTILAGRDALIATLRSLIEQFIALGGTPSPTVLAFLNTPTVNTFTRDLDVGASGPDVTRLQQLLVAQKKGALSLQLAGVGATGFFGPLTKSALAEFQSSVGIIPASGYFGPKTRASMNSL